MRLDAHTVTRLKTKVVEWHTLVNRLAETANDSRLGTSDWWRAQCRLMNPPRRPPTPEEYARTLGAIVDVFHESISDMINRRCILPLVLHAGNASKPIQWGAQ